MNKLKEYIIKVLDEGETTSVKKMKWPSLRIGKYLFVSTAFISPLLACILGSTFMDLNSKEFTILFIPLLLNWGIFLCWVLYHLGGMLQISRKRMILYALCIVVVAVSTINMMYMKRKPAEINLVGYWNRFSNDQELLLQEYLSIMDDDTNKACRILVMPKETFKRLISGQTIATRFCLNSIREALVQNQCYGKEFTLSNRKHSDKFLFDSLSKHFNPLWEMKK